MTEEKIIGMAFGIVLTLFVGFIVKKLKDNGRLGGTSGSSKPVNKQK